VRRFGFGAVWAKKYSWRKLPVPGARHRFSLAFAGQEFSAGRRKEQPGRLRHPSLKREWKEIDRIAFQSRWPEG
jgi:hypothetical protein